MKHRNLIAGILLVMSMAALADYGKFRVMSHENHFLVFNGALSKPGTVIIKVDKKGKARRLARKLNRIAKKDKEKGVYDDGSGNCNDGSSPTENLPDC